MTGHPVRSPEWIDDAPIQARATVDVDASPSVAESVGIEPSAAGCRLICRPGLPARRGWHWLLDLSRRRAPDIPERTLSELGRLAEAA